MSVRVSRRIASRPRGAAHGRTSTRPLEAAGDDHRRRESDHDDHVPSIPGDPGDYMGGKVSMAFALGYIRALMKTVEAEG
jgi:hypothetical protein